MSAKLRNLQVDERTADLLEARAAARGLSVSELLADLAVGDEPLSADLETMRVNGTGPWAPDVLAEDARRLAEFRRARDGVPWDEIEAWMRSWGTSNEGPAPQSRKL